MLAAVVLLAVLQAADGTGVIASFSGFVHGERWEFKVTRTMLAQAPAWEDAEPSPPLPPRRAIAIAAAQLAELLPDSSKWIFTRVSLHHFGTRWVYVVEYDAPPPTPAGGLSMGQVPIVVLMNGATVVPTRSPWP